jgi:nicotinic acid phosphoribosyltransferase
VSDTWDLWKVLTELLPTLKEEIEARDGKLVIRPDSGDPVDILCGLPAGNKSDHQKLLETYFDKGSHLTIVYDSVAKKFAWKSDFASKKAKTYGTLENIESTLNLYDLEEVVEYLDEQLSTFTDKIDEDEILDIVNSTGLGDTVYNFHSDNEDRFSVEDKGWLEPIEFSFVIIHSGHVYKYHSSSSYEIIAHNCNSEETITYIGEVGTPKPKTPADKGVVELLWDLFGGTVNEQGYKVLSPKIGAIYGDSITVERAIQICERLKAKGFASTNVVLGIGSFTYQFNTRDTYGFAVKSTYAEVAGTQNNLSKDPITDDGTKKSATGLLRVTKNPKTGEFVLEEKLTIPGGKLVSENYDSGLLEKVYVDGKFVKRTTIKEVRERLKASHA